MIEELTHLPEGFSYGVLCKSDDVGSFVTWFQTKDLTEAKLLASCITSNPNCLFQAKK